MRWPVKPVTDRRARPAEPWAGRIVTVIGAGLVALGAYFAFASSTYPESAREIHLSDFDDAPSGTWCRLNGPRGGVRRQQGTYLHELVGQSDRGTYLIVVQPELMDGEG